MNRAAVDPGFWSQRRVFITGDTGFKGAWTCLLLKHLGADVVGFALPPKTDSDLFKVAKVAEKVSHQDGDIRDLSSLVSAVDQARPDIVIHMAAQSLVRPSYTDPLETYAVNVMGTAHLLEAVRKVPGVAAALVVTSDKCYENREWAWGYRENEALGGYDPYSSSKGCAELVTASYRNSFLAGQNCNVATARAGNVIGGGDWAADRLVPDAIRAFSRNEPLSIRNPHAVRPWQHVLEPITGYLILLERLVGRGAAFAEAWNFGPGGDSEISVGEVVERLVSLWGANARWVADKGVHPHEAGFLKLDCSKSRQRLGWRPTTQVDDALRMSVDWYRACHAGADMSAFTLHQIREFLGA
jgi:CDP-glucose 4,6-dehydratase